MPCVTMIRRHATARHFKGSLFQYLREVPDAIRVKYVHFAETARVQRPCDSSVFL